MYTHKQIVEKIPNREEEEALDAADGAEGGELIGPLRMCKLVREADRYNTSVEDGVASRCIICTNKL